MRQYRYVMAASDGTSYDFIRRDHFVTDTFDLPELRPDGAGHVDRGRRTDELRAGAGPVGEEGTGVEEGEREEARRKEERRSLTPAGGGVRGNPYQTGRPASRGSAGHAGRSAPAVQEA